MAAVCDTVTRCVLRLAKLLLVGLLLGSGLARAEVRFDAFMGFANKARSNEWFPATFEIENDGPTFEGVIEIKPDFPIRRPSAIPLTCRLTHGSA